MSTGAHRAHVEVYLHRPLSEREAISLADMPPRSYAVITGAIGTSISPPYLGQVVHTNWSATENAILVNGDGWNSEAKGAVEVTPLEAGDVVVIVIKEEV